LAHNSSGTGSGDGNQMKKFNHFFITIFNVKRPKAIFKSVVRELHSRLNRNEFILLNGQKVRNNPETPIRLNEEYLETRFRLFEKFCLPSVGSQSNQNFKWLVFFDQLTPDNYKNRIESYSKYSNFVPIYVDEYNSTTLRAGIADNLTDNPEYLITTNLDNDDAISRDFVKLVQEEFNEQKFAVISFPYGYVWKEPSGKIYLREYLSNPFISLIESVENFKTVYHIPHQEYVSKYAKLGWIKPIKSQPTWMQVIHGSNVRNRVEGIRKPRKNIRYNFSINIENTLMDENLLFIGLELPINYFQSISLKFIREIRERLSSIDKEA
jgi:hypothetical protein